MNASDLFIKALENEGVTHIFGVPGEENLDFLEALRHSKIELILTRHEQGAGFMAATYGRLTGKTGVCLATLGPGATNFVTAAAYAQLGAMPILMITGQKPIKHSKQGQFQIVNIVELMRPITKYARQIVDGKNIPSCVREAIRLAEEERPGAAHIELPEDIAADPIDATELFAPVRPRRPNADDVSIERASKLISQAKRPFLLIGAGANRKRTAASLLAFVDKTQIPFFNTQMGKGVIDERHPLFIGTAALSDNDYLHCAIDRADLIINVGHDVVEKPPFFMEHGGKEVIHINFFSARVDDVYFPQVEIVGDIANSIRRLTTALENKGDWDKESLLRVKKGLDEHIAMQADDDRFPIIPQRLVADVRKAMPSDGILTLDNGIYKIWFARNYAAHESNTLLLDNALATMGAGLPSAMAAKLFFSERKVMAVCGDGGFMMNSQEMETAVRLGLDLVVLLLRDNAYGMIKWKQAGMGLPTYGLDYGNPDFVKYAESYGAHGVHLESSAALLPTLEECLNQSGVHLIEIPVDYSENEKVLIQELKSRVCQI